MFHNSSLKSFIKNLNKYKSFSSAQLLSHKCKLVKSWSNLALVITFLAIAFHFKQNLEFHDLGIFTNLISNKV